MEGFLGKKNNNRKKKKRRREDKIMTETMEYFLKSVEDDIE